MSFIRLFQRAGLGFFIFLLLGSSLAFAQNVTITGIVVDPNNIAIQGAQVAAMTSGGGLGSPPSLLGSGSTNSSGVFSFSVPAGSTFNIFIAPGSLPAGVIFASPAVNTAVQSIFYATAPGPVNTGTFQGQSAATITGTVVESDGFIPIQGAVIFAQTPVGGPSSPPQFLGGDYDGTNRSGQFSFSVPASTQFQIFIDPFSTPGFTFANPAVNTAGNSTFTSPASGTQDIGTFRGQAAVTITGTVQNAQGTAAIQGAVVFALTPGAGPGSPPQFLGGDYDGTNRFGQFSFSVPTSTQFQIFIDSFSTPGFTFANPTVNTAGNSTFTSPASGTQNIGLFRGQAAVTITGTVQNVGGTAVQGAVVFAQTPRGEPGSPPQFLGGDYDGTNSSGQFSFSVPASTQFQIFIDSFSTPGVTFANPAVNTGGNRIFTSLASGSQDIGTFRGQAAVTITGTVQNASGTAIQGAVVFAQTPGGGPGSPPQFLGGDYDGTNSSGQFSFPMPANITLQIFVDPNSTPGSIFSFPAVNTVGQSTFTAGSSGTTSTGTFLAGAAVTVTGTVQNAGGSGVSGAFVFARDASTGKLLGGDWSFTDSSGAFSFPISAGSTFNIFIGAPSGSGLTFSSPAVNTSGQRTFTATAPGPVNTGTFRSST